MLRSALVFTALLFTGSSAHAACGDGRSNSGEACDDGNTDAGDGCDALCNVESDYVCSGSPSVCCAQDAAAQYVLLGSASSEAAQGMITLTPSQTWKQGTAWNRQTLDLSRPFDIAVRFYLGSRDGSSSSSSNDVGGDGATLLFQRDSRALTAQGVFTGQVGQESNELGAKGIAPVLGVELDTYNNGATFGDITSGDEDHTSVFRGGTNPQSNQLTPATCLNDSTTCRNFEDGLWHLLDVRWSSVDRHLVVAIDGVQRIDLARDLAREDFAGDPTNIVFGFAATTGGAYNLQRICPLARVIQDAAPPPPPLEVPDAGVSFDAGHVVIVPSLDAGLQSEVSSIKEGPTPGDLDGDQVPNEVDPAPNDPCIPNRNALACGSGDADGDGLSNEFECPGLRNCRDTDGDGVSDYADLDSDGDGISDAKECPDMNACPQTDGMLDLLTPEAKPLGDGCALSHAPLSSWWLVLLLLSARTGSFVRSATARACGARRSLPWCRAARRRPPAAPRSS